MTDDNRCNNNNKAKVDITTVVDMKIKPFIP